MLTLETGSLILNFSEETGILHGLKSKATGWDILGAGGERGRSGGRERDEGGSGGRRGERGLSWKILLPLSEELRNNHILGEKQKLSSYEARQGELVLKWDGVASERGGEHDIGVALTVRADGAAAVFAIEIDNRSGYVVENVYCPCLINLAPPEGAKKLSAFFDNYATGSEAPIWPRFHSNIGYFGTDYPTQIPHGLGHPSAPFILLRAEAQGLYMGVWSDSAERQNADFLNADYLNWIGELRPGYESSIDQRAPEGGTIAGKPAEIRYSALHVPYIQPGERRALTPVALAAYEGGWQEGVDIYKEWRQGWMKPAAAPAWAREPHAWLQLHINSPEDELRMRFAELPKVAEECLKYGVAAIQLVGWNDGGQDQGNPSHEPDPRLGTFEELRQAIGECQSMGVKIILFAKFIWADRGTKWFRDELKDLACTDPYGDYGLHAGYKYQTGTQLLDINTKRFVPMCFNSERYLEICAAEFRKVVDLGAAGMLHDECLHHGPALLCFHPGHGHRYGQPVYAGDAALTRRLRKVPGCSEDFLFAGEAPYDWQLSEYSLSYYRTESKTHIPVGRYMLPRSQFMTAVTGFNDRNMLNQCLMFRFIASYEPYNFKGRLGDFPATVEYGQKMDALRAKYRKWFWDGEFIGTKGAKVARAAKAAEGAKAAEAAGGAGEGADGCAAEAVESAETAEGARAAGGAGEGADGAGAGDANGAGEEFETFSVFRADDGTLGAVVCNYEDAPVSVNIRKDGGNFRDLRDVQDFREYRLVDGDGWKTLAKSVEIPPRSAIVVL